MATFVTSDTHFGHTRIIELCERPFRDVSHMNESLIENWNSVVGHDDTVIHLGDAALGPWVEWDSIFSRLNGYKVLIIGNHDRIFKANKEKYREKFQPVYEQWFDEIYDEMAMAFHGRWVKFSHFPYDGDSHGEDRYVDARPLDNGEPLVHGHTHDGGNPLSVSSKGSKQFHAGVDAHNYFPVPLSTVLEALGVSE